jgi:hypothetical protein
VRVFFGRRSGRELVELGILELGRGRRRGILELGRARDRELGGWLEQLVELGRRLEQLVELGGRLEQLVELGGRLEQLVELGRAVSGPRPMCARPLFDRACARTVLRSVRL